MRLPQRPRSPDEPGLRPLSPENGHISNIRQRLSASSVPHRPISESGDQPRIHKSPPSAGPSAGIRAISSDRRNGWLATQCRSHLSPGKFPANREFYREFCIFEAKETTFVAREPLCCSHFSSNSLHKLTGKETSVNREFSAGIRELLPVCVTASMHILGEH
jgi:hypothetical protein